ncbi:hypothetical protein ACIBI3_21965 [Actinomadura luteofluorescens]|uniref:hypothetical protein n=1 Tax=Actinomadura luteofluorescens TaxID=46163 RepID=UPI003493EAF5
MTGPEASGPDLVGPDTVELALEALLRQAEAAWKVVQRDADGLSLEGVGDALEWTTDVLDLVWSVVGAVDARAEKVREREMNERVGSALEVMDEALVHLHYGQEGLMVARHLLGLGRSEVLRVARGEV